MGTLACWITYLNDYPYSIFYGSEWTEEEDELLKEVVETCTYGLSKIHWFQGKIRSCMIQVE